jgi:hypothetical protein
VRTRDGERSCPLMDSVTPDGPRRAPIRRHVATVRDARAKSPTARTLVLDLPAWPGHVAGQHVDVRLTAEEGYQAQRSYSIASGRCDHARRTGAHALSRLARRVEGSRAAVR